MSSLPWLDRLDSSQLVLASFFALALLAGVLYLIGVVNALLWIGGRVLSGLLLGGFYCWRKMFSWMPWPVLFGIIVVAQFLAWVTGPELAIADLMIGASLLSIGFFCVMAYMVIDLERYEVTQGYKTLHNPGKGQELATLVLRYGPKCGLPLLLSACLASICGFAIFNAGLYNSVAPSWYVVSPSKRYEKVADDEVVQTHPARYTDFMAYSLLNLASAVDVVDMVNTSQMARLSYVKPRHAAASLMLAAFRAFFTAILLQQLLSWFRRLRLLNDSVKDFWSPNENIQIRAGESLSRQGARAVAYLVRSMEQLDPLTPEQMQFMPKVIAAIGPSAVPTLVGVLDHARPDVREVAAISLGRSKVIGVLPNLAERAGDADERVRRAVVEAFVELFADGVPAVRKRWALKRRMKTVRSGSLWSRYLRKSPRKRARDPVAVVLPVLVGLLTDPSRHVRIGAAAALATLGNEASSATPSLALLVEDEDAGVRQKAAEALGAIREPIDETVAALVHLLDEQPAEVRREALLALAKCGADAAPAVPVFIQMLQDNDEATRQAAAAAIGAVGELDARDIPRLEGGLRHRDNLLRARAAQAIGTIGPPAAVIAPQLAEALKDSNDRVRQQSAWALGRLGADAAVCAPALVQALQDEDFHVAWRAAEAIGAMGPAARNATKGLLAALRHINAEVRRHAAAALTKLEAPADQIIPALTAMATDKDRDVRLTALTSLGDLPAVTPEVVSVLYAALADELPAIRQTTVRSLARLPIEPAKITDALLPLTRDPAPEVRCETVTALGKCDSLPAEGIEALSSLLQDPAEEVQLAAAQALAQIGSSAGAATEPLRTALPQAAATFRAQILRALSAIDADANQTLFIAALEDPDADVRRLASAVLLRTTAPLDAAQVRTLVAGLKEPDAQIRSNIIQVFTRLETLPAEAVPLLLDSVSHPDDGLRLSAIRAIRSVQMSGAHLWPRLLEDTHPQVSFTAARYVLASDPTHPEAVAILERSIVAETIRDRKQAMEVLEELGQRGAAFLAKVRESLTVETDAELRVRAETWIDLVDRSVEPVAESVEAARAE